MKETPLCINFQRFGGYLLAPDEVVLFEWFLFKQNCFGVHRSFHYSKPRIEADTRIGRRRQEAIIEKFQKMGFLMCVNIHDSQKGSLTRNFRIDYNVLSKDEVLTQIIDKDSVLYASCKKYIESVCPF